ncbi:MAG: hypothetical protein PHY31_07460 [Smithellaceae bacterium]|nr:hypothetical protein [Smithellaceae bacterium]
MKKMKRWKALLFTVAFFSWLGAGTAMAASDTSAVTVTVDVIDLLSVSDATGGITLTGTAGSTALTGTPNTAALLNYTFLGTGTKKITAEATTVPSTTQDITLTVAVTGGAGAKTIVNGGTAAAAQDVYTGISTGALSSKTVTYNASATVSGTEANSHPFTVTFSSVSE